MSEIDEKKAPLLDHLIELRKRLMICILAIGVGFAISFYFANEIFGFLIQPIRAAFGAGDHKLIFTKVFEGFLVEVKIGLFGAVVICFPIIANQIWAFVAPGLYAKEKRALLPFLLATPILFFLGAALAYYFVMPAAFRFFLSYQGTVGDMKVEAMPAIGDLLSLEMKFILAFGLSFLMPVLLMLLNRAGIVTRSQLTGMRRYAWVVSFIIAAMLTPPDGISMLMLAIPLVLLYEISLIAIWLTDRRKAKEDSPEPEPKQDVAAAE